MFFLTTLDANATSGTVDSTNKYAYGENIGWINFNPAQGDVVVGDSELTGYAYGENIGWISLNCSNTGTCGTVDYAVDNDGAGVLSGYAWGENIGWINFAPSSGGVEIDSSTGDFSGQAYGENIGWITFNCSTTSTCGDVSYKVSTSWRPTESASPVASSNTTTNRAGGTRRSSSAPSIGPVTSQNPPSQESVEAGFQIASGILREGHYGPDSKKLQNILNIIGFKVAESGPGSLNNETEYFGPLTKSALIRFQNVLGLNPSGIVEDRTKDFLELIYIILSI